MRHWIVCLGLMLVLFLVVLLHLNIAPAMFVEPIGLLLVFGGTALYLLSVFRLHDLSRAWAAAIRGPAGAEEAARGILVFRSGSRAAWVFATISFVIGSIALLTRLDDPKEIGPAIRLGLLSVLYALLLGGLLLGTLRSRLERFAAVAGGGIGR